MLPKAGLDVLDVAPGAIVVARPRVGTELRDFGPGSTLVTEPRRARKHWIEREKRMSSYLAHEHVAALLRLYRVNCVLDVGAHRGEYAERLRGAGYAEHIVSFEPVPEALATLERKAARDPKWRVHPYALGREDGRTTMNVMPGTFSSMLEPTAFGARRYAQLQEPVKEAVEVRRLEGVLDAVVAHIREPRIYLKLDTQGFDLEVFAGLGERAGEIVAMQSELALMAIYEGMPRLPEALAVYEAAGFGVTGLYPVSRQSRTGRVLEFDCVMVRASSV